MLIVMFYNKVPCSFHVSLAYPVSGHDALVRSLCKFARVNLRAYLRDIDAIAVYSERS